LHAGGQGFESPRLHQPEQDKASTPVDFLPVPNHVKYDGLSLNIVPNPVVAHSVTPPSYFGPGQLLAAVRVCLDSFQRFEDLPLDFLGSSRKSSSNLLVGTRRNWDI